MAAHHLSYVNNAKITGSTNSFPGMPITDIIANGLFKVDRRWTVKYWNQAAEKLLGVQAKDIIGKNLW
ncbi:MAG TPA: PAS domain-containing protein, partial [Chitinophagaceae bacterium]|nr:PAS domain-containing protein [Chitinophagaceae bacterium]